MAWRLAKSLETLRDQVNAKWPGRDKSNDGTIGDASHAATKSDHNPNSAEVVTAMDITNDPAHGLVARSLAETLVASRDPRIKYIISNAQIISSVVSPWVWRPYDGPNAHRAHVHISVMAEPSLYDNTVSWRLDGATATQSSSTKRFTNIEATVFAGINDPNNSAYDEHFITDTELGVALPDRIEGIRPKVRVWKDGRSVDCEIVDVGPWNNTPGDPYWLTGQRPLVEQQFANQMPAQNRRVPTNRAAIDLTPAAARAIGLNGKGVVDWEFIGETKMPEVQVIPRVPPDLRPLIEALLPLIPAIVAAIQAAKAGEPIPPLLPPPVVTPPPPPVTTPAVQSGGVQLGGLATVAAIIGQIAGILPPAIGENATTSGILTTVIPAAATLLSPTGIWGTFARVGIAAFMALRNKTT